MTPAQLRSNTNDQRGHRQAGSTTMVALLMLSILAFLGGTILLTVTRRYNGNMQSQAWQEALFAAEGGADIGLANLRWTVVSGSPTPFDSTLGWHTTTSSGNTIRTYTAPTINGTGDGATQSWAVVTVDAPTGTSPSGLQDSSGNQWYRVRSTGHVRLPGMARASIDPLVDLNTRHSNELRKFNLRYDRSTGAALSSPEATRTVEYIVEPKTSGAYALMVRDQLKIDGNQLIDSYDPRDPTKSTNGQYDPTKRQSNGSVYSDSPDSDGLSINKQEMVYGNAATNGGSFTDPQHTIQSPGTINNHTSIPMPAIPVPTWGSAGQPAINPALSTVTSSQTITVSSDPTKNYYKLTDINAPLNIVLGAGVPSGTTLNIWLTNGSGGSGSITIAKGVTVNVYFSGGTFHPNNDSSINNLNLDPSTFTLYGCGTANSTIDLHIGGDEGISNFYGSVYAPYSQLKMKYGGNTNYDPNSAYYGSYVGNSIHLQGSVHYDQALNNAGGGAVTDFARVSYVEDPR